MARTGSAVERPASRLKPFVEANLRRLRVQRGQSTRLSNVIRDSPDWAQTLVNNLNRTVSAEMRDTPEGWRAWHEARAEQDAQEERLVPMVPTEFPAND